MRVPVRSNNMHVRVHNMHVHMHLHEVVYLCFLDILQAGHTQFDCHIVVDLQGHKFVLGGPAEISESSVGQVGRLGIDFCPYQTA